MELTFCTATLWTHIHLSAKCYLLSVKNKRRKAQKKWILKHAREHSWNFPQDLYRKIESESRTASGLWVHTGSNYLALLPVPSSLVCAYRFGICAVSASFLISYILPANWSWGWSCGGVAATAATIIINNQAAAPVSRIAFVSSDVLLPLLAERKVKRFFSLVFFCASLAALSLWGFLHH